MPIATKIAQLANVIEQDFANVTLAGAQANGKPTVSFRGFTIQTQEKRLAALGSVVMLRITSKGSLTNEGTFDSAGMGQDVLSAMKRLHCLVQGVVERDVLDPIMAALGLT